MKDQKMKREIEREQIWRVILSTFTPRRGGGAITKVKQRAEKENLTISAGVTT